MIEMKILYFPILNTLRECPASNTNTNIPSFSMYMMVLSQLQRRITTLNINNAKKNFKLGIDLRNLYRTFQTLFGIGPRNLYKTFHPQINSVN